MRRLLGAVAAAVLLGLLAGCAGSPVHEAAPAAVPEESARPELKLPTAGGLPDVGRRLAEILRARFPDAQGGHLLLAWDRKAAWLSPLGKGFSSNWPSCLLAADLGLAGTRAEEVFIQLDPSYFRGLLWIQPGLSPAGALDSLTVELRSLGSGPTWEATIPCEPALSLSRQAPKEHGAALPPAWLALSEVPRALAFEELPPRLWVASPDKITRLDLASRKVIQEWNLPPSPGTGRSRAVLSLLSEEQAGMGWFDLERGQGRVYEKKSGDAAEPAGSLDGYPLTERVLRFIRAPFDSGQGVFAVQDFRGQELGLCVDIARFGGPDGTHFGLLGPDGAVRVLRGSDVALINGPVSFQAAAIAGLEGLLVVASQSPPYEVGAFRLSPRGGWEQAWKGPNLPGAPTALCGAVIGGTPSLFVAIPSAAGSALYLVPIRAERESPTP